MFGFLKRGQKPEAKKPKQPKHDKPTARSRPRKREPKAHITETASSRQIIGDQGYDVVKKISDLQDQLSRHDSRIHGKIDEHHNFMQNQHHEPMKKVAIEIMNKLYTQPLPVREEVFKMIKTDEEILSIIGDGKMGAGQVAGQIGVTREHVSRRISNLTKAGLLTRINEGKYVFYAKPEDTSMDAEDE
jgi:DNA-binding transcriptional ArsR family regulator